MPGRKEKPLVWQPQYYRSVAAAERAAVRIADVFRCRTVIRKKRLDDNPGLWGVWREDVELTREEERERYEATGWLLVEVEDARTYTEDGDLKEDQ